MCMSNLGKPTDQDLDQYPHVLCTSPHEWDPSVLDYAHPNIHGFPGPLIPQSEINMTPGLMSVVTSKADKFRHFPFYLKNTSLLSRSMFSNLLPLITIS